MSTLSVSSQQFGRGRGAVANARGARRPDEDRLPVARDGGDDGIRWDLVALAKQRIAAGTYDDPAFLDAAVDKMLDDLT